MIGKYLKWWGYIIKFKDINKRYIILDRVLEVGEFFGERDYEFNLYLRWKEFVYLYFNVSFLVVVRKKERILIFFWF